MGSKMSLQPCTQPSGQAVTEARLLPEEAWYQPGVRTAKPFTARPQSDTGGTWHLPGGRSRPPDAKAVLGGGQGLEAVL